jgi:hypothetical protein
MSVFNYLIFAAVAASVTVALTGCKSSKPSVQKGSTEVSIPFTEKEYRSDKDHFRATQQGKSPDLATAKKIALANARTELAGNIQTLVKAVQDQYSNNMTVDKEQEFEASFQEFSRAVIAQSINDVKIIGDKVFTEKGGGYTYYLAIEMPKEALVSKLSKRISDDDKLKLEFDKYRFQKIFDEEMEKAGI